MTETTLRTSAQSTPTQPAISGMANIANVVQALWERTADRLTPSELEWFAGASEYAIQNMQNLEEVIEGIGCLVIFDTPGAGHAPVGSFQQPRDVAILLFFLAESMRHASALVTVADAAEYRLRNPDLFCARAAAKAGCSVHSGS
ncbi:MAG: hypothetical protein FWD62_11775 [Betaproteobacteria bacterium]|nr:hypothetical protein [Betaproteobacteria bacterium]